MVQSKMVDALPDIFSIVGIPFQVLLCAGEWTADAFSKTCQESRQLAAENRSMLLAAWPQAEYWGSTSLEVVPPIQDSQQAAATLLTGQLKLRGGGASAEQQRTWEAVSSDCSRLHCLRSQLSPASEGLIPLPCPEWSSYGAALVGTEGHLYLCGGWDEEDGGSETSELWDPKTEEWIPMPKLPPQVACRAWEAAGILAYQLSICTQTPQTKQTRPAHLSSILPRSHQTKPQATSCAWRFDCESGDWQPLRPLLRPRAEAAVGVIDGRIYLCGGMDRSGVLASCERLDPLSGLWEMLPPMLRPRAWASAGIIGGKLHVCGGFGEDGAPVATAECFNPVTNSWELAEQQSLKRAISGFVVACPKASPSDS